MSESRGPTRACPCEGRGKQFTSLGFTQVRHDRGVRVSMDEKGRYPNNVLPGPVDEAFHYQFLTVLYICQRICCQHICWFDML